MVLARVAAGGDFTRAVAALCVILSGIATYAIARQLTLNSDETQSFLAAQSILHGNVLLGGWHLSVDNFFVDDTLAFVIMEGVFGSSIAEIPVLSAIIQMAMLICALAACMGQDRPRRRRLIGLAVIVLLLGARPPPGFTCPFCCRDCTALGLCCRCSPCFAWRVWAALAGCGGAGSSRGSCRPPARQSPAIHSR